MDSSLAKTISTRLNSNFVATYCGPALHFSAEERTTKVSKSRVFLKRTFHGIRGRIPSLNCLGVSVSNVGISNYGQRGLFSIAMVAIKIPQNNNSQIHDSNVTIEWLCTQEVHGLMKGQLRDCMIKAAITGDSTARNQPRVVEKQTIDDDVAADTGNAASLTPMETDAKTCTTTGCDASAMRALVLVFTPVAIPLPAAATGVTPAPPPTASDISRLVAEMYNGDGSNTSAGAGAGAAVGGSSSSSSSSGPDVSPASCISTTTASTRTDTSTSASTSTSVSSSKKQGKGSSNGSSDAAAGAEASVSATRGQSKQLVAVCSVLGVTTHKAATGAGAAPNTRVGTFVRRMHPVSLPHQCKIRTAAATASAAGSGVSASDRKKGTFSSTSDKSSSHSGASAIKSSRAGVVLLPIDGWKLYLPGSKAGRSVAHSSTVTVQISRNCCEVTPPTAAKQQVHAIVYTKPSHGQQQQRLHRNTAKTTEIGSNQSEGAVANRRQTRKRTAGSDVVCGESLPPALFFHYLYNNKSDPGDDFNRKQHIRSNKSSDDKHDWGAILKATVATAVNNAQRMTPNGTSSSSACTGFWQQESSVADFVATTLSMCVAQNHPNCNNIGTAPCSYGIAAVNSNNNNSNNNNKSSKKSGSLKNTAAHASLRAAHATDIEELIGSTVSAYVERREGDVRGAISCPWCTDFHLPRNASRIQFRTPGGGGGGDGSRCGAWTRRTALGMFYLMQHLQLNHSEIVCKEHRRADNSSSDKKKSKGSRTASKSRGNKSRQTARAKHRLILDSESSEDGQGMELGSSSDDCQEGSNIYSSPSIPVSVIRLKYQLLVDESNCAHILVAKAPPVGVVGGTGVSIGVSNGSDDGEVDEQQEIEYNFIFRGRRICIHNGIDTAEPLVTVHVSTDAHVGVGLGVIPSLPLVIRNFLPPIPTARVNRTLVTPADVKIAQREARRKAYATERARRVDSQARTLFYHPTSTMPMSEREEKCSLGSWNEYFDRNPGSSDSTLSVIATVPSSPHVVISNVNLRAVSISNGSAPPHTMPLIPQSLQVPFEVAFSQQQINEFDDVPAEEKAFMNLWNLHATRVSRASTVPSNSGYSTRVYGDAYVPMMCEAFVRRYGHEIQTLRLRYIFLAHLVQLYDFGLLLAEDVTALIQAVDEDYIEAKAGNKPLKYGESRVLLDENGQAEGIGGEEANEGDDTTAAGMCTGDDAAAAAGGSGGMEPTVSDTTKQQVVELGDVDDEYIDL